MPFFFFFSPFSYFLNAFWKQAFFIYSKYTSQVRKQIKKSINQSKRAPTRQATPLCSDEMQIEEKEEKEPVLPRAQVVVIL